MAQLREGNRKYRGFPNKLKEELSKYKRSIRHRMKENGQVLFKSDKFLEDLDWYIIKKKSIEKTKEMTKSLERDDCLFFMLVPNKRGEARVISMSGIERDINLLTKSKKTSTYYSCDENIPHNVKTYPPIQLTDLEEGWIFLNGEKIRCYNATDVILESGKKYWVEGMTTSTLNKKTGGLNSSKEVLIITDVQEYRKDFCDMNKIKKRINDIHDLSPQYNLETKESILDDEEAWIIPSALFSKKGSIGINLIISGPPQIGKSAILSAYAYIFDETEIDGTQTRPKALTPSFYDANNIKTGLLESSDHVALMNEVFRFLEGSGTTNRKYEKFKEMAAQFTGTLERTERTVGSGVGDMDYCFTSSFISTSNVESLQFVKDLWQDDPAPLYRFTFLKLSDETLKNLKNKPELGLDSYPKALVDILPLSKKQYKDLFVYANENIFPNVNFNFQRISGLVDNITEHGQRLKGKATHLIKAIVSLRWFLEDRTSLKAKEKDYQLAEKLLDRCHDDFIDLISDKSNPFT